MQNYGTWKASSDLSGARPKLQTGRLGKGNFDLLGARKRGCGVEGRQGGCGAHEGTALTVTHASEELRLWAWLPNMPPSCALGRNSHRITYCLERFFKMVFQNDTPS